MSTVAKELFDEVQGKLDRANHRIGVLEMQLVEREKVLLILKVRSRIEELERKFLPIQALDDSRRNKWGKIMRSPNQYYTNNIELMQFRASVTMDVSLFINIICLLYGDFSDIAAHKINFPIAHDKASIEQMLKDVGITPDESKIAAVEIVLTPIPLP